MKKFTQKYASRIKKGFLDDVATRICDVINCAHDDESRHDVDILRIIAEEPEVALLNRKRHGASPPQHLAGSFFKYGRRHAIFVNPDMRESQQRFTAAHELAHFLLHRDKLGNYPGGLGDILYTSDSISAGLLTEKHRKLTDKFENEADEMACDILMPPDKVNRYIEERSKQGVVRAIDLTREFGVPIDRVASHLSRIPPPKVETCE